MKSLPLRFESKVERTDTCWLWLGATNSRGYGCWGVEGVSQLAHRVAYELLVGPIPEGLTIDHLCFNKVCVNPAHMEPVTREENSRRKERVIRPTHCPQGHELTDDNLYVKNRSDGHGINRYCKTCKRASLNRWRAKKRQSAA